MVITELGPDFLRGTMPVDARTCQPMRLLHGGASVAFAETLASIASNSSVGAGQAAVGQEINANHLRPAYEGETVTGTTRLLHAGARSQVWSIEICNAKGQLVCVSRITMAIIRQR
jgi:1,4-dihydroxy-2-naphthoyl-CoA hydrolase